MCAQIQQALRQAIRERRLQPGMVVPSTRTLAADLGVARGVVVEVYDQLVAEGYLIAIPGSATRVTTSARPAAVPPCKPDQPAFEIDFRPGHPDLGSFPWKAWRHSTRRETPGLSESCWCESDVALWSLGRLSSSGAKGRRFESCRARHLSD